MSIGIVVSSLASSVNYIGLQIILIYNEIDILKYWREYYIYLILIIVQLHNLK